MLTEALPSPQLYRFPSFTRARSLLKEPLVVSTLQVKPGSAGSFAVTLPEKMSSMLLLYKKV